MAVGRAGGRHVILSVFVFVRQLVVAIIGDLDERKRTGRAGKSNQAIEIFQIVRRAAFVPHVHGVASVRNGRDRHVAGMIRDGKVRSCDGNHDRAHFRMNVAEKEANAGSIKSRGIGRAPFVETEIEALAVEEREDVMKETDPCWETEPSSPPG